MNQPHKLPAAIAQTLSDQPTALAAAWRGRRTIRVRGEAVGAELAGRLLADESVQSVVVSPSGDEATVHLAHRPKKQESPESMLRELADLAGQQQQSLVATTRKVQAAGEIVCWLDRGRGTDSYYRLPEMATGGKRAVLSAAGSLFHAAAQVANLLPIVPAAPLALLAAECWLRSDREKHKALLKAANFGGRLSQWYSHRQIEQTGGDSVRVLSALMLVVALPSAGAAWLCLAANAGWLGWLQFGADCAEE